MDWTISASLIMGTDPLNGDTWGNGLNDSEDPCSFAPNVDRIWVAYDPANYT